MLEQKSSYILSLQGKDVYERPIVITENKKRDCALDFSLGTVKLQEIAKEVLPKTKSDKLFFQDEKGKQFTNAVISLSFDYNICEFNKVMIGDEVFFKHKDSDLTHSQIQEAYELEYFKNGIYSDTIEPIEVIKIGEDTSLTSKQLPTGFKEEEGKIQITSSGSKSVVSRPEIRRKLYVDGFKVIFQRKGRKDEEIEYVRFIRSAGSARQGTCLFIMKKLYNKMMEWLLMDLKMDTTKTMDIAGLESYLSLVFSSAIGFVDIKPENILVIDDYESKFKTRCVVTTDITDENGDCKLFTEEKEIEQSNKINDGQSLLSKEVFERAGYGDKGFLLLRNRFMKSACFNTNIQQFFKDNNITNISQLKGYTKAKKLEDILMITTPSSIKYVKYGSLDEYMNKVENTYSIVKYEKPTHHFGGSKVSLHYQLINSLQFTPELMEEFLQPNLDYYMRLKTDIEFLKEHLKINTDLDVKLNGNETKDDFIFKMLSVCSRFEETTMFKIFRRDLCKAYKNNLKKGHVLVDGTYTTMVGNPYEMLQLSCGLFNGDSFLDTDEVYCNFFKWEEETINSRSPHVAFGNNWISKNCTKEKAEILERYFNFTPQICVVNSINNNLLERLSGCDFDADTVLLTNNKILVDLAKKNYDKYLPPTGKVHSKAQDLKYTNEDKATLDTNTCNNLIGQVINSSQIINSKIWELIHQGKEEEAKQLYIVTSHLDVLSNLCIDSAKKTFNANLKQELKWIKEKYIDNDLKPTFFHFINEQKGNKSDKKKYRDYYTSMDFLVKIVDKTSRKRIKGNSVNNGIRLTDIILRGDKFKQNNNSYNKIAVENIVEKGLSTKVEINNVWNSFEDKDDKFIKFKLLTEDFKFYIQKYNLKPIDIKKIIYKIERNEKYATARKYIMNELYKMYPKHFLELFSDK